ncbi:MAG: hypothetical protein VXX04_01840 [Actinomycetota bacterium]|nr:hypothetical protein [Actinomycetota bacterium]
MSEEKMNEEQIGELDLTVDWSEVKGQSKDIERVIRRRKNRLVEIRRESDQLNRDINVLEAKLEYLRRLEHYYYTASDSSPLDLGEQVEKAELVETSGRGREIDTSVADEPSDILAYIQTCVQGIVSGQRKTFSKERVIQMLLSGEVGLPKFKIDREILEPWLDNYLMGRFDSCDEDVITEKIQNL